MHEVINHDRMKLFAYKNLIDSIIRHIGSMQHRWSKFAYISWYIIAAITKLRVDLRSHVIQLFSTATKEPMTTRQR